MPARLDDECWALASVAMFMSAVKNPVASIPCSVVFFQNTTRDSYEMYRRAGLLRHALRYPPSEVGAAHLDELQGAAERRLRQLKAALGRVFAKAGSADADAFDAELRKAEHDFDGDAARCRFAALKLEGVDERTAF